MSLRLRTLTTTQLQVNYSEDVRNVERQRMSGSVKPELFSQEVINRFEAKYTRGDPDEDDNCWEWQASIGAHGYGYFRFNGKTGLAHRFAWMLHNNQLITVGLDVRHICDNRPCVRWDHLELGTRQDNVNDMLDRVYLPIVTCKRGHEFTPENTYTFLKPNGRIQRNCKTCNLTGSKRRKGK